MMEIFVIMELVERHQEHGFNKKRLKDVREISINTFTCKLAPFRI